MIPQFQDQHKIPKVYLKQFGYKHGSQWKVSVLQKGEHFIRQKSIGSFTAETNVFDINHESEEIVRLFENLNCDLENEYNPIIEELENGDTISERSHAMLLQLVPNLISRSDSWRNWIRGLLEHENKPYWIHAFLAHNAKDYEDYLQIPQTKLYQRLINSEISDNLINEVLLFFTDYLLHRIQYYKVVILESPEGREWFTTDNPVLLKYEIEEKEILGKNSELYLPLSPKYLSYYHLESATDTANPLRSLETRKKYQALDVLNEGEFKTIVDEINSNLDSFLICPGYMKYNSKEEPINI